MTEVRARVASRRALVTGAGGFVGANLLHRLIADGHRVTGVIRPGGDHWRLHRAAGDAELEEVDLCDEDALGRLVARVRPEWVFHLAAHGAYSWQSDGRRIVATNMMATVALVDACRQVGCEAFVHAGSSSEYGFKDHAPVEVEPPAPNSRYAVAKAAATLFCRYMGEHEGFPALTLRLYSVFGPYEDPRRLVPTLISHGLRGELPPLVGPDVARDFVWVADVADAFVTAACGPLRPGAVYNVGSGVQTTVSDMVDLARKVLGVDREPEWGSMTERAWDTARWVADNTTIATELGWRPSTSLEAGFTGTVEWLRESPALWDIYDVRR